MIDVFLRSNFTADTNAMAVGFWREFADAEEAVGNSTGAGALRALADSIAAAVNQRLWGPRSGNSTSRGAPAGGRGTVGVAGAARSLGGGTGDHYITQLNPDNTTRDFVDYDANFIALAYGIPPDAGHANAVLGRIASGACPHARGGWVSEKYYGRKDCQRGITGDSWCSMGRISWFNALARKRYGDQAYFDGQILDPLVDDVIRYTWMHERGGCDGSPHTNRTPYYFEFPSVTAMAVHYIRYGIQIGLLNVTVSPFGPREFTYHVGSVHVDYSSALQSVNVTVPGTVLHTRSSPPGRAGVCVDAGHHLDLAVRALGCTRAARRPARGGVGANLTPARTAVQSVKPRTSPHMCAMPRLSGCFRHGHAHDRH